MPTAPSMKTSLSKRRSQTPKTSTKVSRAQEKLFVLDTNVLLHDPECLFNFEENDIALPMVVLEELDNHKRGMTDLARNARQANRVLDVLLSGCTDFTQGVALSRAGRAHARGKLFFIVDNLQAEDWQGIATGSNDNEILAVVRMLTRTQTHRLVVLVSKDINIRVKAMALGLKSNDYTTDQAIDDARLLYSGFDELSNQDWQNLKVESWVAEGRTHYRLQGAKIAEWGLNQTIFLPNSSGKDKDFPLRVRAINGKVAELSQIADRSYERHNVWGVTARNREQNVALDLLLDEQIDLVTILGSAGSGKTLLTLAAGIAQTFDMKRFEDIIITRATVPIGDDIGFLPGTEEEKMNPWMGALEDNLQVLTREKTAPSDVPSASPAIGGLAGSHPSRRQFHLEESLQSGIDFLRTRIKVKSLSFMRGRTFTHRFLIIDEAQNLTSAQLKTLITRAGTGTKVVCLGNLAQIDTPYLTPLTSGLTWLVERFKHWQHHGHIVLQRGERSRLANFAEQAFI